MAYAQDCKSCNGSSILPRLSRLNPQIVDHNYCPLAQLVAQETLNLKVPGSSPGGASYIGGVAGRSGNRALNPRLPQG